MYKTNFSCYTGCFIIRFSKVKKDEKSHFFAHYFFKYRKKIVRTNMNGYTIIFTIEMKRSTVTVTPCIHIKVKNFSCHL